MNAYEEDQLGDIADQYLEAMPNATGVKCPLTGEDVLEFKEAYDFPGYPEVICKKILASRSMSAQDYYNIFASKDEGYFLKGFVSKKGNLFNAKIFYNPDKEFNGERRPGFDFKFEKPESKGTGVRCPKTNEEVQEFEKYYRFAGWPKVACWKNAGSRKMSAEDYRKVLSGESPVFEFISKNTGKPFKSKLKLNGDKVTYDFDRD